MSQMGFIQSPPFPVASDPQAPSPITLDVHVQREPRFGLSRWAVRLNGRFVVDFHRENRAWRTAHNLRVALSDIGQGD